MTPLADDREAARTAFVMWAAPQPGAPPDPASLIEQVDVSHDGVGLLSTDAYGRREVWKSVPASARARVTAPSISSASVDAWAIEAGTLRERSDHVAICDMCNGNKKISCNACEGVGTHRCTACKSEGKVYGYAANGAYRLLNCTSCRGKGERDCGDCRRGIATCVRCQGEGRLQRWMGIESWRRPLSAVHPEEIAARLGWNDDPSNDAVGRDGYISADISRPHRLTSADLPPFVPPQWLDVFTVPLQSGERVVRQRLRVVSIPTSTVVFRSGDDVAHAAFRGRRLLPQSDRADVFARRAVKLRLWRLLLLVSSFLLALISLARGTFYWSIPTLLSILAFALGSGAMYGVVAKWTADRPVRRWAFSGASLLITAFVLAFAALPRLEHAERLIAAGQLAAAESELRALSDDDDVARVRAELQLARVRQATDVPTARDALAQIARNAPQYEIGSAVVDQLIMRVADGHIRGKKLTTAADTLGLLSHRARAQPAAAAAARAVYVPLANDFILRKEWAAAANALMQARAFGVASADLDASTSALRNAAEEAAADAKRERDPRRRLQLRIEAEQILVSWERASARWGTPPLIRLRTALARDLAIVENRARRVRAR